MFSSLSFFISAAQWLLIALSYFKGWARVFGLVFFYPSPVLLFFTLISVIGVDYGGDTTNYLIASGIFNAVKYGILIRALYVEGLNFYTISAAIAEAAYVGTSGLYLLRNNYFG